MKKICILLAILLIGLIVLYEMYHISLIIIYGFPANIFLLLFVFMYFFTKNNKYGKVLVTLFPNLKPALIILIASVCLVTVVAPIIVLYSNYFDYQSVFVTELSIIEFRDYFIKITGLGITELTAIFIGLLLLSYLSRVNLAPVYTKCSNIISLITLFLFAITSFSLTSHHLIEKKTTEILSDLESKSKGLDEELLKYNKFILSCNLLRHTFSIDEFKNKLIKENIEEKIYQNPKLTSMHLASYIATYVNTVIPSKEINTRKQRNGSSVGKLRKLLSQNSTKLNKLTFLEKKSSILKTNTINFISDILNKLLHTEQTGVFNIFANTLITDLNGKISNAIVNHSVNKNGRILSKNSIASFNRYIIKFTFSKQIDNIKYSCINSAFRNNFYKHFKPKIKRFRFKFR